MKIRISIARFLFCWLGMCSSLLIGQSRIPFPIILSSHLSALQDITSRSPLTTPLSQEILTALANETSGQTAFNNEVRLAGAPWIRSREELKSRFLESTLIHRIVKEEYGISTTRIDRYDRDQNFTYPLEGELWIIEPEKRRLARLDSDAALIASGSSSVDTTGDLIYLPPFNEKRLKDLEANTDSEPFKGKIALMWAFPRGREAKLLDKSGLSGVISFSARDRYSDPNQVVYSRGSFSGHNNFKFGMTVSWRQWSELLEDVEDGKPLKVRCRTLVEEFPDRFENVVSWIPGVETDKKGILFTAHLFEGYTKRGANDNMSGCIVQLEILRSLNELINKGLLPRPRRTITFLWCNEISGTFEHIKQHPGLADNLSCVINMDMVGEALRKNNALFTMTECPNHLPSYLDGLGNSILNYVWRTNDIVYSPDSPRGRSGQHFPDPLWEKNGSKDAFRYYLHGATGGSDHICFINPMVAVPAIELNIWPDQWYHADTDTPDKSDPTQLRRTAFIGAAMALAAADCTDEVLQEMIQTVSDYGYYRIGKRDLPESLRVINGATLDNLPFRVELAGSLIRLGADREYGALSSIKHIFSDSTNARSQLENILYEWEIYRDKLLLQIKDAATRKALQLKTALPEGLNSWAPTLSSHQTHPSIHPDIQGREFYLERSQIYRDFAKSYPDAVRQTGLNRAQRRAVLNYINGRRPIDMIRTYVIAETRQPLNRDRLVHYLDLLKKIGWIIF
ncbi:MAG: M28 family peptidase [Candidatus Aminicenantes bacterium]|nr:M28 family peptidase [Candidatus Aminicenantes bacterium]